MPEVKYQKNTPEPLPTTHIWSAEANHGTKVKLSARDDAQSWFTISVDRGYNNGGNTMKISRDEAEALRDLLDAAINNVGRL